MKKVILSEQTLGVCIDGLSKVTDDICSSQCFRNQHPAIQFRGVNVYAKEVLSDVRVSVHSAHTEGNTPLPKRETPLIHITMGDDSATSFYPGDVFYFGSSEVRVDEKKFAKLISNSGCYRHVIAFKRLARAKS